MKPWKLAKNENEFKDDILWDMVQFTFVVRDFSLFFDIFNGNTLTLVPTGLPAQAYVTGGLANYNSFINGCFYSPKVIRRISVSANKDEYLEQPFNLLSKDANGQEIIVPKYVNTFFSADQFQNLVNVDFAPGEFVIDNLSYISQYYFSPSSVVKFVIYYKELKRSDMLGCPAQTIMKQLERERGQKSPQARDADMKFETYPYACVKNPVK